VDLIPCFYRTNHDIRLITIIVVNKHVSIIVPAYNCEKYINDAIESILIQTYEDLEIIIVNDGSTDNTAKIIDNLAQVDSRIKVISQSNKGAGAARNKAISVAKGEFIAFLDSDDIMLEKRIQEQVQYLIKHPEITIVSCLAYYINEANDIIGKISTNLLTVADGKRYLERGKLIYCLQSGVMTRKQALKKVGGYREELLLGQDTELWNRMVEVGYNLVVMPKILVKYRIRDGSTMTQFKKYFFYIDMIDFNIQRRRKGFREYSKEEFKKFLVSQPWYLKVARFNLRYSQYLYRLSGLMYGNKKYINFILYLLGAFFINPVYTMKKLYNQKFRGLNNSLKPS